MGNSISLVYAQKKVSIPNKEVSIPNKEVIEAQNWLNRASTLTSKLKDDLFSLSESQKAVTLVQITKLWWIEDNSEARNALKKAVSLVSIMDTDDDSVRNEKLATARKLIPMVISFDRKSADILIAGIEKAEKEKSSDLNAKAILQSALTVVSIDPQQAFQLGMMSLHYGIFQQTITLIAQLSLRDESLASTLAIQTANLAVQRSENTWINALSSLIFIAFKGQYFSDNAKKTILDIGFNDTFNRQTDSDSCNSVLRELNLITFYDQYFPDKSNFIRQKGIACRQGAGTFASDTIGEKLGEKAPKNVDELISAAQNSKNPDEKAEYYMKAIKILEESKEYLKVLTILDDIEEDDRKVLGDFGDEPVWDYLRRNDAYKACLGLLKEDDLNAIESIVKNTPEYLRPILQNDLATQLSKSKNNSYAFELMQAVRKNISKVKNKNLATDAYLELFHTYITLQPSEATVVFSELIKIINESDSFASKNNLPGFRSHEPIVALPAKLLEIDEAGTYASLAFLNSSESKIKLRLGLIASSLKKYKEKLDASKIKQTVKS